MAKGPPLCFDDDPGRGILVRKIILSRRPAGKFVVGTVGVCLAAGQHGHRGVMVEGLDGSGRNMMFMLPKRRRRYCFVVLLCGLGALGQLV